MSIFSKKPIQRNEKSQSLDDSGSKKKTGPRSIERSVLQSRRYSPAEVAAILKDRKLGARYSELLDKYGVCRETVTRWRRREIGHSAPALLNSFKNNENEGDQAGPSETLKDLHSGYHKNWREVLHLWRSRPGLGPAQIRNQLFRQEIKISVATVRKVMEENGYTPPKTAIKEVRLNRYEAARPRELVHMDFKHFYINKHKVYLLLLQDDFSRFLCGYKMTDSENMDAVIEVFEECINHYGKMQTVMTDAGSAFYSWNGINRFQKLLSEEYGVDQIKAGSPRSNGKIENVNKQIEKECLDVKTYSSLEEADEAIGEWVRFYNFERTHQGLPAGMVPADRFLSGWNSSQVSPGHLKPVERKEQVRPSLEEHRAEPSPRSRPVIDSNEQTIWEEILKLALDKIKRAA